MRDYDDAGVNKTAKKKMNAVMSGVADAVEKETDVKTLKSTPGMFANAWVNVVLNENIPFDE